MQETHKSQYNPRVIRTPDQRLRVFVSSTLRELADERKAVQKAVTDLRLSPVMFELGARPHPPRDLYRAYLEQSHVFIGLYWERYGWVAPDMDISGLEDEYRLAGNIPKLIYIKSPSPGIEEGLKDLLRDIKNDANVSYRYFSTPEELEELVGNDLALILTERFEQADLSIPSAPVDELAPSNRLPVPLTSLIGRETELQDLQELLTTPDIRLITLTGPGGVGKTSLCLELASLMKVKFVDGVQWIPLASIRNPDLVVSEIASNLDVRERAGYALKDSLIDYLRDKHMLLLLDNFEQVQSEGPLIAELLMASPQLKVIVTSRAVLQVRGEHEYLVNPLQVPDIESSIYEHLQQNPAVQLFVERVRAVNPSFRLTSENAADVAAIVTRLDGLPLAIELAAPRMKFLSTRDLRQRLDSSFDLLTDGARDLPDRQQTIDQAIEWSYNLLDENARKLLSRLSVFVAGFTLESAESVCSSDKEINLIDGISSSLNNSLIQQAPLIETQTRYQMLETIREFAYEKLREFGEMDLTQRKQAEFFSEMAAQAEPNYFSGESEKWLDKMGLEYNNYQFVLDWCQQNADQIQRSWKIIVNLLWLWYRRGYLNEARQRYETAIRQSENSGEDPIRAMLLVNSGAVAMWQSDYKTSTGLMESGLAILRKLDEPYYLAEALFMRGVLAVQQDDHENAIAYLEEALELGRQFEQEWFQAMIILHLGNVYLSMGDIETTRESMQTALMLGRKVGDGWVTASAINNLGEIERYNGNHQQAEQYYLDSKDLFQKVGAAPDVARANHSLAYPSYFRGEIEKAKTLFQDSLIEYQRLGVKRGVLEGLLGMALILLHRGYPAESVTLLSLVQNEFEELGAGIWPADRIVFQDTLDGARKQLQNQDYSTAQERGNRMSADDALQYALKFLDKD